LDEQATKPNLDELIVRWLPSVSQPGDTAFICFSGHAGQVDNRDGTEPDGKDELIGPYDLEGGYRQGDAPARCRPCRSPEPCHPFPPEGSPP
jgi:hypothetical protein